MMLEEDKEIRESMDPTTLQNFIHWRDRLNAISVEEPAKDPPPPQWRGGDNHPTRKRPPQQ